jgi:Ca-activated chloride channel family protein
LTNIRLETKDIELYDLEPANIPDMLAQRPIMVIGKYRKASDNASLTLKGVSGLGDQEWSFQLQDAQDSDNTLPQLWARKRLERLYVIPAASKNEQRENIVKLGLQYALLTRHTSFVAVDETVRNTAAEAKDIKQPLPLPKGVSNHAVGQPMPEPELLWVGLMVLLILSISRMWRNRHAFQA